MSNLSASEQITIVVAFLVLGGIIFGVILAGSFVDVIFIILFALLLIAAFAMWLREVIKRRRMRGPAE